MIQAATGCSNSSRRHTDGTSYTSPRHADPEVREWPVDLNFQLESMVLIQNQNAMPLDSCHDGNDGQWTPEEHELSVA